MVASRFEGHGKMIGCPRLRGFLSICVSYLMRVWVRLPQVKDYSTFYKAYRVSVLKRGFQMYGDDLLSGEGFAVSCGQLARQIGNEADEDDQRLPATDVAVCRNAKFPPSQIAMSRAHPRVRVTGQARPRQDVGRAAQQRAMKR